MSGRSYNATMREAAADYVAETKTNRTDRLSADDLRHVEKLYQRSRARAERFRAERNQVVLQAIAEGWTHAAISSATGLSRGRISQIKP